jgi:hypothetical protein
LHHGRFFSFIFLCGTLTRFEWFDCPHPTAAEPADPGDRMI